MAKLINLIPKQNVIVKEVEEKMVFPEMDDVKAAIKK
jgi:hypothetical protein